MGCLSGRTRIFGILADPIHHVKTPEMMNTLLARHGVDAALVPFHVRPEGLGALVGGLRRMENFGGFIATVPHKTAMLGLCDEVAPDARRIGAVNCVRRDRDGRMIGAMLDGTGFVEGLRRSGHAVAGRSALLVGAGGAGKAIAFALAAAGVARLGIANRTPERAAALWMSVAEAHPGLDVAPVSDDPTGFDIVVNATSLGMRSDDPMPLDAEKLDTGQLVAEIVMEPGTTPLLAAATRRGCAVQPGRPMLAAQIALMAEHMRAI